MNLQRRDTDRAEQRRARLFVVGGRVQGVGFRPFVYRQATANAVSGWVRNETSRVVIHAEGSAAALAKFEMALILAAPPLAEPHLVSASDIVPEGARGFSILVSTPAEQADIHLPPDLFCCDDCVSELCDPAARRYRYPFTNCTQCGPRYTIIASLPYDRANTSMSGFVLCPQCDGEYRDPLDRRFHAQPLACPNCGPALSFRKRRATAEGSDALTRAIGCLRNGDIVAVKGVGGYHLICDAANDAAIARLRARKHRPDKPLAVMFPQTGADGLDAARQSVVLSDADAQALVGGTRPIVLAFRRDDCPLSSALAPGLDQLGVFLPYSPLHHLLLADFGHPIVATSGNISGEPVITANEEAERRLPTVADAFLHHNRPILRPADDPVVRTIAGTARSIRVGRGLAPVELELPCAFSQPTLAVGGQMKGAVALGFGHRAVISPHIGELDSPRSIDVFAQTIADLQAIYRVSATRIVCDHHPGYASARWAKAQQLAVTPAQHHIAHASALAGEYPAIRRWLVLTWDGLGLGDGDELWGGETLIGAPGLWQRAASLRPFTLTGGDRAGREPWRSAAAVMWEIGRAWMPAVPNAELAKEIWAKQIGTRRTSSAGRLFDAAAALILGVETISFEGQVAMMLEAVAEAGSAAIPLPIRRDETGLWRVDWQPLFAVIADAAIAPATRAGIFHESLAYNIADQVLKLRPLEQFDAVGLTGGVFQNRLLAERTVARLRAIGSLAYLPRVVPANDGGLAFGQLIECLYRDKATPASLPTGQT